MQTLTQGGWTQYLGNKFLDHVLGNTVFTAPATLYLGLWNRLLDASMTGASLGELSATGYARLAITNDETVFPAAVGRLKANGVEFTFPAAQADWGTIVSVAFCDASTAGNALLFAELVTPRTVLLGEVLRFPASSLRFEAYRA